MRRCLILDGCYPTFRVDDWALEAEALARDWIGKGDPTTVFWMPEPPVPAGGAAEVKAHLEEIGCRLITPATLGFQIPKDVVLENIPYLRRPVVIDLALRQAAAQGIEFDEIHFPAAGGAALRVLQARKSGVAFPHTRIVVHLIGVGAISRRQNCRHKITPRDITTDFFERECCELADETVCGVAELAAYLSDRWDWQIPNLRLAPLAAPPGENAGEAGSSQAVPVFLGEPLGTPHFTLFTKAAAEENRFGTWVIAHGIDKQNPLAGQIAKLAAESSARGKKFGAQPPKDWSALGANLRNLGAVVVCPSESLSPRVLWLASQGVRMVISRDFAATLSGGDPAMTETLRPITFNPRQPAALLQAMERAQEFKGWDVLRDLIARARTNVAVSTEPGAAGANVRFPGGSASSPDLFQTRSGQESDPPEDFQTRPGQESDPPEDLQRSGLRPVAAGAAKGGSVSGGRPEDLTVTLSHYNLGPVLEPALRSLAEQSVSGFKTLIVDDGSEEEPAREIWEKCKKEFRDFRFIELPHAGYWGPRNWAMDQCETPLLAIVDGDNLFRPRMVECFVNAMARNPDTHVFTHYITSFQEDAGVPAPGAFRATHKPFGSDFVSTFRHNLLGDTNAVFRIGALRTVGGYRMGCTHPYADWDIYMRMLMAGLRIDVIPEVLMHYRLRPGAMIQQRHKYFGIEEFLADMELDFTKLRRSERLRLIAALHGLQQ